MKRRFWQARRAALSLGAPGLAGIALILAAISGQVAVVRPLQQHLAMQSTQLRHLEQGRSVQRATRSIPVAADAWTRVLPDAGSIPAVTNRLAGLAEEQGIALDQGQYSLEPVAGTHLLRWRARFPVTAGYPALKRFMATSLDALPSLTLDGFKVERQDIGAEMVHAELAFSLYVRDGA